MNSLVLVTIDCLRADHAGFMGYPRATTPFLDSLVGESLVVPTAIVSGAPTYYSFPGIMAGRYPLALGRDVLGLAPGEPSLATTLGEAGYRTAAFNAGNVYLTPRFGYDQGFELYCDFLDTELSEQNQSHARRNSQPAWYSRLNRSLERVSHRLTPLSAAYDELYFRYCQWLTSRSKQPMDQLRRVPAANVLVDQALTWVGGINTQPFFLWLHFMDAHHPYYPPEEALAAIGRPDIDANRARSLNTCWDRGDSGAGRLATVRENVVALYDAAIRWVDMQLARLVDGLSELGRWANTAMVVTADHGEEFLEHGGRHHAPTKLTDELIHVPLLMRTPAVAKIEIGTSPFSMLHLAPTVLDSLGVIAPVEFQGRSQWANFRRGSIVDEPVVVEVVDGCTNPFRARDRSGPRLLAVQDSRHKLVFRFGDGKEELFDVEADPSEQSPLPVGSAGQARRRLLEVAKAHVARSARELDSRARVRAMLAKVGRELEKSQDRAVPQYRHASTGT